VSRVDSGVQHGHVDARPGEAGRPGLRRADLRHAVGEGGLDLLVEVDLGRPGEGARAGNCAAPALLNGRCVCLELLLQRLPERVRLGLRLPAGDGADGRQRARLGHVAGQRRLLGRQLPVVDDQRDRRGGLVGVPLPDELRDVEQLAVEERADVRAVVDRPDVQVAVLAHGVEAGGEGGGRAVARAVGDRDRLPSVRERFDDEPVARDERDRVRVDDGDRRGLAGGLCQRGRARGQEDEERECCREHAREACPSGRR
jgi:hypothetical protein